MKLKVIFLTLLVPFLVMGQNETQEGTKWKKTHKHALGFGAGFSTGYGLGYRYMPSRIGAQVVLAPYKDDYQTSHNVGITFFYSLAEVDRFHFFLYQANSFFYDKYKTYYSVYPYAEEESDFEETYLNHGIGFGGEVTFLDRIGFNMMVGYAARRNFERLGITAETGLFFKF